MLLKDIALTKIIPRNSYLSYLFYNIYCSIEDKKINNISQNLSTYDSILDTSHLVSFKKQILENKSIFYSKNLHATQHRMYGLHQEIFKNINDKCLIHYPSIEHGLIFRNSNWSDTSATSRASCLTYGVFRKKILRNHYDTPIFCIGPYIHYASDYYNEQQFITLKSKLGKTLLVFPTHSTDDSNIISSHTKFLDKILNLAKNFNSVLVCAFWWNIDDPLLLKLKSIGCKIVSAGYREDILFLSRLKTIIKLSDFCVGDSVGTHIGYCIHLNKPFSFFNSGTSVISSNLNSENLNHIEYHTNIIKNVFLDSDHINNKHIEVSNYYWGLNKLKSNEDILNIFNINKMITKKSFGFTDRFSLNTKVLLKSNMLSQEQKDLLRISLL